MLCGDIFLNVFTANVFFSEFFLLIIHQKKLRTRITDLESQLGQVQEELNRFKEQLASAEVDNKREEAQELVEKTNTRIPAQDPPHTQDKNSSLGKLPEENAISISNLETEVFEVPLVPVPVECRIDLTHVPNQADRETKPIEGCSELGDEPSKLLGLSNLPEKTEMSELQVILAKKKKEIESISAENDKLKQQASEAATKICVAQAKEEETVLKLNHIGVELEEAKAEAVHAAEELKAAVEAKIALETEMKKLRVQTEQWKKAASAAASVLAGEVEMGGRWAAAQSSSLGKHVGFELAGNAGLDSAEDFDEGLEGGKRKGTGIRMFGDLWKKKGQK